MLFKILFYIKQTFKVIIYSYIALSLFSCINSSQQTPTHGDLQIWLHDAPIQGNVEEVNVTITGIRIIAEEGEIHNVSDEVIDFDLLTLTPDKPLSILTASLPIGRYCQIRLLFAETNNIVVDGVANELKTPSAQEWQSGFKIDGCFDVEGGAFVTLTLDFDPNLSIVYNPGPDRYILKPVIQIVNTGEVIINTYNMQTPYQGQAYVAQFNTGGSFQYLQSGDPRYVFVGSYAYDNTTNLVRLNYTNLITIDPDCSSCGILDIQPIDNSAADPRLLEFELIDYGENFLKLKITATGETLDFFSRIAFGAFDEL